MATQINGALMDDKIQAKKNIDFKYIVAVILGNWYWILLSLILSVGLGILLYYYSTPKYEVDATILVNGKNGNSTSGTTTETDLLSQISVLGGQSNVNNELAIITSRTILENTIRDMQLNVTYWGQGPTIYQEIYKSSPFYIKLIGKINTAAFADYEPKEYDIRIKNGKVHFKNVKSDSTFGASFGDTLKFNYGKWILLRNDSVPLPAATYPLGMKIYTPGTTYLQYLKVFTCTIASTDVTTIDMELDYPVPQEGQDVLQHIIDLYIKSDIDDYNLVADSTIAFIDRKLIEVSHGLSDIESGIETFKKHNNIANIEEQAKTLITNGVSVTSELEQQDVKYKVIQQLIDYLSDERKLESPVPTTAPIDDPSFVTLLNKYNSMQLERQHMLVSNTESNPLVKNVDAELAQERGDLLKMLRSFQSSITVSQANYQKQLGTYQGGMQAVPTQQREFLDYSRQQDVAQKLYLYLLETKEQTAIGKSSNINPVRIVDAPEAVPKPYWPNILILLPLAVILGLVVPAIVFFLREILNNKVITKDDIAEHVNLPVSAEINQSVSTDAIVVNKESRSATAEQFRTLRTNLQFLLANTNGKTIMVTSSMSGEGKSFISMNLAMALAITNKKVVLLEMDLRKPKISEKLGLDNSRGISNYIAAATTIDELIKPSGFHPDFFVISSGSIPPNPSELLINPKLDELFAELKKRFDFIIIDTPPVGLVTDAVLINRFTDIVFYIVKQKSTFVKQLEIVKELNETGRLKNINIILNGMKRIAGYSYGYKFGYGYGYYTNEKRRSFFSRMFNRG